MKKLMIAAAIVCAAAFAQAASFGWSSAKLGYDAAGNKYTGTPTDGSMVLVLLNNGAAADWSAFESATVVSTASTYTYNAGRPTPPVPESFTVQGTMNDDSNLVVDNWYAVLFQDKEGTLHRLNAYGTDTALDTSVQVTAWGGGAADPVTLSTGSDKFTFASTPWQVAGAVPEPTSGLLLLIGVAGLALRRRRA